jgi:hypothetical protein
MSIKYVSKTAEVIIDDKKLILTPLTLTELVKIEELNSQVKELGGVRYVQECSKLINASARRANPELSDSEVSMTLDLAAWQFVWNELLKLSGLEVPAPADEAKPSEVQPA